MPRSRFKKRDSTLRPLLDLNIILYTEKNISMLPPFFLLLAAVVHQHAHVVATTKRARPPAQIETSLSPPPPAVYWMSSPTLSNETLVVAGAGLAGATVDLCADAECARQIPTPHSPATWDQSLQLVLPLSLTPPTFIRIRGDNNSGGPTLPLNAPDVWWAAPGSPGTTPGDGGRQLDRRHPSWVNASVVAGDRLRVFGRSLGWDATGRTCLSGAVAPDPVDTTTLRYRLRFPEWFTGGSYVCISEM